MKYLLILLILSITYGASSQTSRGDPEFVDGANPDIEKTQSVYRIANDSVFSQVAKLSATLPKYGPTLAVGIGPPFATCIIVKNNEDADSGKYYRASVYQYDDLFGITEVTIDGNISHYRYIGVFQNKEIWGKLKAEVLRQSRAIRDAIRKKSSVQESKERIERNSGDK